MNVQKIVAEYPLDYCKMLEAAYGKNLMSEGGTAAIDHLFHNLNLNNKTVLDIGSGLGGLVFYIAEKHHALAIGLEINQALVAEAERRTTKPLKNKVKFVYYNGVEAMPFTNASFDIVCSKGVLTHLEDKTFLLQDVFRVLKIDGKLVINDWLSVEADRLSPSLQKMCELENLSIFPQTEADYIKLLKQAGFVNIRSRDDSSLHYEYYLAIVRHLAQPTVHQNFCKNFGDKLYTDSVQGYQYIADAIAANELIIVTFSADKAP